MGMSEKEPAVMSLSTTWCEQRYVGPRGWFGQAGTHPRLPFLSRRRVGRVLVDSLLLHLQGRRWEKPGGEASSLVRAGVAPSSSSAKQR